MDGILDQQPPHIVTVNIDLPELPNRERNGRAVYPHRTPAELEYLWNSPYFAFMWPSQR